MTACVGGKGGANPEIAGMNYNVEFVGGNVILSMVLANIHIDGGLVIPIPKYPNSSLQVGPDFLSDGTLLVLTVNGTDFLGSGGATFDPQKLPDGRALPAVAKGEMPSVALQIPKLMNTVFYIGPQVIGFFVPFKLQIAGDAILTFRFYDKNNKAIGILGLIGAVTPGLQSGVLAMMRADLMGIIGGGKR
jgi:hypothetical protein